MDLLQYEVCVNTTKFIITTDSNDNIIVDDSYKRYLYYLLNNDWFDGIQIERIIQEMGYHRENYFHLKYENNDLDLFISRCY